MVYVYLGNDCLLCCEHIDSYPLYASPLHGGENEDNNYCQGKFNFQLTFHMAISITCFKLYVYFYMYQYCTNKY